MYAYIEGLDIQALLDVSPSESDNANPFFSRGLGKGFPQRGVQGAASPPASIYDAIGQAILKLATAMRSLFTL